MSKVQLQAKAVKVICNNCFQEIYVYRDEEGFIKYKCPKCGSVTVSKVMGRRHVQIDMYAPQGQEIIDT